MLLPATVDLYCIWLLIACFICINGFLDFSILQFSSISGCWFVAVVSNVEQINQFVFSKSFHVWLSLLNQLQIEPSCRFSCPQKTRACIQCSACRVLLHLHNSPFGSESICFYCIYTANESIRVEKEMKAKRCLELGSS